MAVDNWEETKNKLYIKYRELTHTVIQYLDCMIDGYKIRIIYSRRNNIELILLIFYRGENFYINEVEENKYLNNIPFEILNNILSKGNLNSFYVKVSKEINERIEEFQAINGKDNIIKEIDKRLNLKENQKSVEDRKMNIDKYYDPTVTIDSIKDRESIIDYMEKYHIMTDATFFGLEDQQGLTENLTQLKTILSEVDISFSYRGLYDKNTGATYGYGAIYYIFDNDILNNEKARIIALNIAKKYMDNNN